MHRENLDAAIAIMRRAEQRGSMWMPFFQTARVVKTEAELHACGNRACFAGHVAISPEWAAAGGTADFQGAPVMDDLVGDSAIAEWLDVTFKTARSLVFGDLTQKKSGVEYSTYYRMLWTNVTATDVIAKLVEIRDGHA